MVEQTVKCSNTAEHPPKMDLILNHSWPTTRSFHTFFSSISTPITLLTPQKSFLHILTKLYTVFEMILRLRLDFHLTLTLNLHSAIHLRFHLSLVLEFPIYYASVLCQSQLNSKCKCALSTFFDCYEFYVVPLEAPRLSVFSLCV